LPGYGGLVRAAARAKEKTNVTTTYRVHPVG
jgi:hypothetical protein